MDEQKLLRRRSKALKENNENVLISVCTDLANLYVEEGRYDFAIEEYTIVADIYKKQKNMIKYAVVNRGIGEAYLGLHKFDKALYHQNQYWEIAKELKDKLEEQRALATIGHIYLTRYLEAPEESEKSNLNLANRFFMKSLMICENLGNEATKVEVADMSARLFSNLGVVQDCLGNFDKASELINKSINLCKTYDLHEQLQRGYVSLASILEKRGDNKAALQQYNLAIEEAKKLRNKPVLLATVLLSKSEVLVKLGDFHGAKCSLLKAYKLKITDPKERRIIEHNLRVVAAMCNIENKLVTTQDTDHRAFKILYEKMGDAACDLKCFEKALDYYKKMLDSAKKAGMVGSDLSTCYYSLAETYKDNGDFEEAVAYFEMELELCQNSLKDSLNTLSKIADTKECANCAVSEVQTVYNRAIDKCQQYGNVHEEGRMVKRFIAYLRRQNRHSEAFQFERKLEKLNYNSSDSDSENSEVQASSVIGADIDLDAITDVSDGSDVEQSIPTKTRRRSNFSIKKNIKGETQLHTACIKGKLNVVRHLLEQGHPVNVRDNCGWLPLHEACIAGHFDIVQILIERGAAINDRGGKGCEGITPLHDAASNGHLEVVQLLLSSGANAVAKTDEGDTVLQYLKKWRSTVQLDDETERLYQSIVGQITQALDKAGQSDDHVVEIGSLSPENRDLRRSTTVGLENDDDSSCFNDIAEDYRNVMESLRHKTQKTSPKNTVMKRSALVAADEMIDDWLEDDLGKNYKKRKTNSPFKAKTPRKSDNDVLVIDNDDFQMTSDDEDAVDYETRNTPSTSRSPVKTLFKKRKQQAKLTNFGHTRTFVEADSTSSHSVNKKSSTASPLPRVLSFDNAQQPVIDPTLSVDVRINNKLYRVPVLLSQVNTYTIKWLADEAAARYAKKEYMIPILELETKNGAILAEDDSIRLLFPMGSSQAEEVEGRIVKWNVPPLVNRFKEACQVMSINPNEAICQALEELSVTLDLSNMGLKGTTLAPLCKVLNRQANLVELHLAGNFLSTECVQLLAISLPSLHNLSKLNLSCTGLSSEHVEVLASKLPTDGPYKLTDFDLSDNQISDQSFESLSLLTQRFPLKKLNLSCNRFTKNIFTHSNNDSFLTMDQIEEFDVSDNGLDNEAIIKLVSWLQASNVKKLNFSRNCVNHGFLKDLLNNWSEMGATKLQVFKLSRCKVQDSDIFDLLGISDSLETLDLSYNDELTSISLRKLLQYDTIVTLDLYGCNNILNYFTEFSRFVEQSSYKCNKGKTIKLNVDLQNKSKESEYLINMWKEWYGHRTIVEQNSQLLCLRVSE